jgi:cytochrome oxidase Cu insertion factor (SCO1/SenC/PrrC family)
MMNIGCIISNLCLLLVILRGMTLRHSKSTFLVKQSMDVNLMVEFHHDIIGLTGSWADIQAVCKAFRVYFSTPPDVRPGQDYLVDHSIFFYLMGFSSNGQSLMWVDPDNNFVEVYGRNLSGPETSKRIMGHIQDWQKEHPNEK